MHGSNIINNYSSYQKQVCSNSIVDGNSINARSSWNAENTVLMNRICNKQWKVQNVLSIHHKSLTQLKSLRYLVLDSLQN